MSLIPITTPLREFKGHEHRVTTVAVFPDKRRMVTGSADKTVRLWDLRTGVLLKKMQGHRSDLGRLVVSRDGRLIASGDIGGEIIIWHGQTGVPLTQPIRAHPNGISSLDFSPDDRVLATSGGAIKLWNTKTWEQEGQTRYCGAIRCLRFSPSGEFLAIATIEDIEVYDPSLHWQCVASFKAHPGVNLSLVWTPDGSRLLTCGNNRDSTICEWDTTTWQQVGDPWTGHTNHITAIAVNPTGTLVASASDDKHVRLWRLSDRRTVAIFEHSSSPECVTFLLDGNHILSGGDSRVISEWVGPQGIQDLDSTSHAVLAKRSKARMGNMLYNEALLDAQKVRWHLLRLFHN
jgi:WD40 repeat protein